MAKFYNLQILVGMVFYHIPYCFIIFRFIIFSKISIPQRKERGPFGLSASLLPWVIKNFFSPPYDLSKIWTLLGRAGGRAGVFTVCPISFEDLNIFSIFLLNFVY